MQNQIETNSGGFPSPAKEALAEPVPLDTLIPEGQAEQEPVLVPHLEFEANTLANSAPTAPAAEQPTQIDEPRQEETPPALPDVDMKTADPVSETAVAQAESIKEEPVAAPLPSVEHPSPVMLAEEQEDPEAIARHLMQVIAKKLPPHKVRRMTTEENVENYLELEEGQPGAGKDGSGPVYIDCDIY